MRTSVPATRAMAKGLDADVDCTCKATDFFLARPRASTGGRRARCTHRGAKIRTTLLFRHSHSHRAPEGFAKAHTAEKPDGLPPNGCSGLDDISSWLAARR